MNDAVLVGGAALVGVAVVGPLLNRAIVWWIGWRVDAAAVPRPGARPWPRWAARLPGAGRVGERRAPNGLRAVPAAVVAARCRGCGAGLARGYVAVELVTGALFAVTAGVVGWSAALVPLLALAAGSVAMSAVDLAIAHPHPASCTTAGLVGRGLVLAALVDGPVRRLGGAAVGAAAYGGFLLVLHLISPAPSASATCGWPRWWAVAGWCAWRVDHPVLAPVQGAPSTPGCWRASWARWWDWSCCWSGAATTRSPFGHAIAAGGPVVALGLV